MYYYTISMIKVSYNQEEGEDLCYKYPQIELTFEVFDGFVSCEGDEGLIVFKPETLGDSGEWQKLLDSIENKTNYSVKSYGTNSNYCVSHNRGSLSISIGAYGSGMVGSLTVFVPLSENNKKLLEKIKRVAECAENDVEYLDIDDDKPPKKTVVRSE